MDFPKSTENRALPEAIRRFYTRLNKSVTQDTPGDASSERQANVRYMKRALGAFRAREPRIQLEWVEPEFSDGQVRKRALRRREAVLEHRYGTWYRQDGSVI